MPVPQDGPTAIEVELKPEAPLSAFGERARAALVGLLERMGFGMKLVIGENADEVYVDLITSHYHEALVARELELLDSIEHLVEKAAIGHGQLEEGAPKKKVNLDANGIRAKADVDLAHSARQMAERAIEEDRVFKLGPLDPRARRVVHLTLKEFPGVVTKSEGEGVFRRVCIIPKSTPENVSVEATSVGDSDSSEG